MLPFVLFSTVVVHIYFVLKAVYILSFSDKKALGRTIPLYILERIDISIQKHFNKASSF